MKKTLITTLSVLTTLATLSSGNACAQGAGNVTVYGLFDAAVRYATNVSANRGSQKTMEDGVFTGSRLGFRGREELGGGLMVLFTLESGFDPGTGTSLQSTATADYGQVAANPRFWGREIHVGLRGGWDALVMVYFVCCGVSRLARYNVTAETLSAGADKVAYFEGTPIPTSVALTAPRDTASRPRAPDPA